MKKTVTYHNIEFTFFVELYAGTRPLSGNFHRLSISATGYNKVYEIADQQIDRQLEAVQEEAKLWAEKGFFNKAVLAFKELGFE